MFYSPIMTWNAALSDGRARVEAAGQGEAAEASGKQLTVSMSFYIKQEDHTSTLPYPRRYSNNCQTLGSENLPSQP